MKPPLIIIAGPTACGKTDTAVALAEKINGEIISADSMQVYKLMDIGTAKPSREEMRGIKHHLIDCIYPDEEFSVATFQQMAKTAVAEIYKAGKIPILVGGTGFYINAFLNDNEFTKTDVDNNYRNSLWELAKEKGNDYLYKRLQEVDPEACEKIHKNNVKRVIRALEYFEQTSEKISHHNAEQRRRGSSYNELFIILNMPREKLYQRIELRVDDMLKRGLVQEVRKLLELGYNRKSTSMQGLGYKEIAAYLMEECSLDDAVATLKQSTRHFAKRQVTWFKNQSKGDWINVDEFQNTGIIVGKIASIFEIHTKGGNCDG